MYFSKRQLQTTKWKNNKINCNTTGGVPSQIKLTEMQENLGQKNLVNAILHLIFGGRFQK